MTQISISALEVGEAEKHGLASFFYISMLFKQEDTDLFKSVWAAITKSRLDGLNNIYLS